MSKDKKTNINYMQLSDQAVSAIMMALQKGIIEREDISDELKNFALVESEEGLVVNNPPRFKIEEDEMDDGDDVIVNPD